MRSHPVPRSPVVVLVSLSWAACTQVGSGRLEERATRDASRFGETRDEEARLRPAAFLLPVRPPSARELRIEGPTGVGVAYRPKRSADGSVAIYLHAMCGIASHFALTLEDAIPENVLLVAPEGNRSCGTGSMWIGDGATIAALVESTLDRVDAVSDGLRIDREAPRLLIGFSQGAAVALRLARQERGKYSRLLLIGMRLDTSADDLHRAGVERVVLAAGGRDAAALSMQALARQLDAEGYPVRFVSFPNTGHWIPLEGNEILREPIQWRARGRSAGTSESTKPAKQRLRER